jgi:hypothetical protein
MPMQQLHLHLQQQQLQLQQQLCRPRPEGGLAELLRRPRVLSIGNPFSIEYHPPVHLLLLLLLVVVACTSRTASREGEP